MIRTQNWAGGRQTRAVLTREPAGGRLSDDPLLRARAGYTRDDSFCHVQAPLFHSEYYTVPLRPQPVPLTLCPQCGDRLNQGSVHKITDPEEEQQVRKVEPHFHAGLVTG